MFSVSDNSNYNLRSVTHLSRPIVHYGTESITNLGAKIWELVPQNIKKRKHFFIFKSQVKKWIPKNYSCHLCKTKLDLFKFFAKSYNTWLIAESYKFRQTQFFAAGFCLGFYEFLMMATRLTSSEVDVSVIQIFRQCSTGICKKLKKIFTVKCTWSWSRDIVSESVTQHQ